MSSSPRLPVRPVLALLLATFGLQACGHKKPPIPPPRMIPQAVFNLRIQQRGHEAVVRFPYPTTNYRGVALSGIERIEVYRLVNEIPADAVQLYEEKVEDWKKETEEYQEALRERQMAGLATPEGAVEDGEGEAEGLDEQIAEGVVEETIDRDATSPVEPFEELEEPPSPRQDEAEEPDEVLEEETPLEEAMSVEPAGGADEEEAGLEGVEGVEGEEPEEETLRAPGPRPSPVDLILVDSRRYEKDAEVIATLEGSELDSAVQGADVILRVPLEPPAGEGTVGYVFAVRTWSTEGLESALSPIGPPAKLLYQEPPAAPDSLAIEPQPRGIQLEWTASETPEEGFRIYRRDAQAREYTESIGTVGPEITQYTDYGATLGARYIYAVTAVTRSAPLLESALSVEREILYQDRFEPDPPGSLVAFPEEGQVRVLWDASPSDDVVGYIIYRRREGGSAKALDDEPIDDLEYVDTDIEPGQVLLYAAVAVDGAGNRSAASPEVRVRIP
ncbi:MAG: hypothetical protein R2991_08745 [Thermoanaerobaculia bacterium]